MKIRLLSAALVAVGVLTACNIESTLDDLEKSAIDAAFKSIQDAARQKGGDAVLVRPGAEYVIEINNPQSPINGAKVVIPAAAIPADVEQAAVAIYGIDGSGPFTSSDSHKLMGPVASIGFTKLPGAEEVTPLADLKITLPYTEAATAPAEQMVLLNFNGDGSLAEFSDSSAAGGKVTGGSKKYNTFGSFWAVDYDGATPAPEDSLIYKVTSSDGNKSCAGLVENVAARIPEKGFTYNGTDFTFVLVVTPALSISSDNGSAPRPVSNTLNMLAAPYDAITLSCTTLDGTVLGGAVQAAGTMEATVGGWVETAAPQTIGANFRYTGTLNIDAVLDFTAADGSTVKARLNTTLTDFLWDEFGI